MLILMKQTHTESTVEKGSHKKPLAKVRDFAVSKARQGVNAPLIHGEAGAKVHSRRAPTPALEDIYYELMSDADGN